VCKKLRGADIVAKSLDRLGCERIFTLSGNHIMSIFDAVLDTKIQLTHVRHEAAAVHMADGWGRLTDQPGGRTLGRGHHRRFGRRPAECGHFPTTGPALLARLKRSPTPSMLS
jgi:acetolactate synthase I/II/III large subunit